MVFRSKLNLISRPVDSDEYYHGELSCTRSEVSEKEANECGEAAEEVNGRGSVCLFGLAAWRRKDGVPVAYALKFKLQAALATSLDQVQRCTINS
jgi:hypothetical protein